MAPELERARAAAIVDLAAIRANAATLAGALGDETELCAVVKADGYGHGAAEVAGAALAGGAGVLAVATAAEAAELRRALPEARIIVLGALSQAELALALEAGAEIAVWRAGFLEAARAATAAGGRRVAVHVKHDSGMGRLGTSDPGEVREVCALAERADEIELAGLWTHFATADDLDSEFFDEQLERFAELAGELRARHPGLCIHAANSAATLRDERSHFDMVRCGIALYGLDPFGEDPFARGLSPALELRSYVADVKPFAAGMSAGYGRTWIAEEPTEVAVLPIGYGDGVRRGLSNNGEVLVGGRRYPIVGTVSMDNITVDLGSDSGVRAGDEAIVIGRQGDESVLAESLARRLDTINYEITCGISPRVPRTHLDPPERPA